MPKEVDYPSLGPTTHFCKLHLNFHFFHLYYIVVSVNLSLPHLHYLEASWNLAWNPSFKVFQHDLKFLPKMPKMCVACLVTSIKWASYYYFHVSMCLLITFIVRWKCINHFFKTNSYYFEIKQCLFFRHLHVTTLVIMWLNEIEMIKHFLHEMFEYVFWLTYFVFKKMH